jgi:DNA invertase Pin-like site-specific DNA recombinase
MRELFPHFTLNQHQTPPFGIFINSYSKGLASPVIYAVTYRRKSPTNNGGGGDRSLAQQTSGIAADAFRKGFVIIRQFEDYETGGPDATRNGLDECVAFMSDPANNVTVFIVYRLDRLHRNVLKTVEFITVKLKSVRVSFLSVADHGM